MSRKEAIHEMLDKIAMEVFEFIKEQEPLSDDNRWVMIGDINRSLELNFVAVQQARGGQGKGWLLGVITRMLEDKDLIEYRTVNRRSSCRSKLK